MLSKTLFILLVVASNGKEYASAPMPLEHCVAKLQQERAGLAAIQKKHPKFSVTLKCVKED
jgi:hypothetical protein